jgi:hypothetical protein
MLELVALTKQESNILSVDPEQKLKKILLIMMHNINKQVLPKYMSQQSVTKIYVTRAKLLTIKYM